MREWIRWAGWFLLLLPLAGLAGVVVLTSAGAVLSAPATGIAVSATAVGSALCTIGWILVTDVRSLDAADRDRKLVRRALSGDASAVPAPPDPAVRLGNFLTWVLAFVWFGFLRWDLPLWALLDLP